MNDLNKIKHPKIEIGEPIRTTLRKIQIIKCNWNNTNTGTWHFKNLKSQKQKLFMTYMFVYHHEYIEEFQKWLQSKVNKN